MHQFRPLPPYQQFEEIDMVEGQPFEDVVASLVDARKAADAREAMAATDGANATATAPSLIAALQSTMTPDTTGRLVVIPAERKRERTTGVKPHLSRRLRHGIILGTILCVVITTLIYLAPLNSAQGKYPVLSSFSQWIQSLPMDWQVPAHPVPAAQNNTGTTAPAPPAIDLPKSQYVSIARQDAIDAGIPPDYFVRQINQESGFNPNAVSPAGAVGIAQFLPNTAAGLGVNPYDPISSLRGAARLMASYAKQYGGDYAKALAAYNGGSGTVDNAVHACGSSWLNCLPGESRNYIYTIMGM